MIILKMFQHDLVCHAPQLIEAGCFTADSVCVTAQLIAEGLVVAKIIHSLQFLFNVVIADASGSQEYVLMSVRHHFKE